MTFVGVRIENDELEVGFRAATREEYERQMALVVAAANWRWPPAPSAPAGVEATEENRGREQDRSWLGRQGLGG